MYSVHVDITHCPRLLYWRVYLVSTTHTHTLDHADRRGVYRNVLVYTLFLYARGASVIR